MTDLETGDRAIARIFEEDSDCVVGMGFWISPGLLVTCAHVVNRSLRLEDTLETIPEKEVKLDFPFLRSGRLRAKVTHWFSVDQTQMNRDIAVLKVLDNLPQGLVAVSLAEPTGKLLITKGYPKGYTNFPLGAEVTISEPGATANGWIQLENPEGRVSGGFSGGLVWEKSSGTAAGMIVSTAEKSVAFMIPASGIAEILGVRLSINVRSREPRDDNTKKIIFMLPASLESENSRRWIGEVGKAQSSINKADNCAGRYEFKFSLDTNASTLSKELSGYKPYIVHFSGNAEGIAAVVCGDISSSQSTDVNDQYDKQIGDLFKWHSQDCPPYLECVILSGCNKEGQRREIVQYIESVIEINKELEEKCAIEFVDQFYFHLASKKDVRLAFDLAQEYLKRVEKVGKDILPRIFTRINEIKCRELEKELGECDEEIIKDPKNIIFLRKKVTLLVDLAGLLQDSSRKDEIDSIYNAIASLEPDNYKNRVKQGDALTSLGDYEKAESAYDKATESEDGDKDYMVWWKKAMALVKDEEYERASECYKNALTLLASLSQSSTHTEANSDRYVIYREYGNTLIYLEKTCKGIKSYRNSLRLQPNYRVSNYEKKQAYRKLYS